ncbi:MAG: hypothetical protein H6739_22315 [Alphaproteobacteria bacterium]|nr:hypothetical protein [Alphaproteobacteria bacterium]
MRTLIPLALLLAACGADPQPPATPSTPAVPAAPAAEAPDAAAEVWACPMDPEVTGQEGDECNKCGMKLEGMTQAHHTELMKKHSGEHHGGEHHMQ